MANRIPLLVLTSLTIAMFSGAATQARAQSPSENTVADNAKLNPCPGLYYEAPLNERFLSPEGCPPNAARQAQQLQSTSRNAPEAGLPTVNTPESFPSVPANSTVQPLPEELGSAIARVTPQAQQINVTFTNDTNALITYEVIGQTDRRILSGGETVVLRGLSLPTTISAVRNDSGLLNFNAAVDDAGQLTVMLDANPQFNEIQGVLQIQEDGEVFLN